MALRYVVASGGSTTASGTDPQVPITSSRAASVAVAGDSLQFAGGTYTANFALTNNGAAGNPITLFAATGATVIFQGELDLIGKSYVIVQDFNFRSDGNFSIDSSNTTSRITIDGCTFQSYGTWVSTWVFAQLHMRGRYWIIRDCWFYEWVGSDGLQLWGEFHLFEKNHMGWHDTGHGSYIGYCGRSVFRENYIRNKWSGVREFVGRPETGSVEYSAPNNLIEDNTFYDMGYAGTGGSSSNEGYPAKGWAIGPTSSPGDHQHMKLGGMGTIFRNNLFVGGNEAQTEVLERPYRCNIHITPYVEGPQTGHNSVYMGNMRLYHNTFYDNKYNWMTVDYNANLHPIVEMDDNRLLNNVVHLQDLAAIRFQPSTQQYFDSWHFHKNIITGTVVEHGVRTHATIVAFQTFFSEEHPGQATGNSATAPTLVNPVHSDIHADRDLELPRNRFLISPTSPVGYQTAIPLTTVTSGSTGTTINVADAFVFFPDSNTVVPGDMIRIGSQTRRVMTRNSATQITVNSAITVSAGNAIYLDKYGAAPSVGIAPLVADDPGGGGGDLPIALNTTPLLKQGLSGNATVFTTNAVTAPTAGALLILAVHLTNSSVTAVPVTLTVANGTLGGVSAWTQIGATAADWSHEAGTDTHAHLFWATVTGTPSSGTIAITASGVVDRWVASVWEITGANNAAPIVQFAGGTSASTTPTFNLPSVPTAGNLVMGFLNSRAEFSSGGNDTTPGSGYTEVMDESPLGSSAWMSVIYKTTSLGQQINWTDAWNIRNVYAGIEIAAGGGAYTLDAAAASFALTGVAAGLKAQRKITAGLASYIETGIAANLLRGTRVAAGVGDFIITANNLGLLAGRRVALAAAEYTLLGQQVQFHNTYSLALAAASFALSGQDVGLLAQHSLAAGASSFALAGNALNLYRGYAADAEAGVFVLAGQAVSPLWGRRLPLDAASYALTGNALGLLAQRFMSADNVFYALTGLDVVLDYSPINEPGAYIMTAGPGNFSLFLQDSIVRQARRLAAGSAEYVTSGQVLGMTFGRRLIAAPSSYILSGVNTRTLYGRSVQALPGVFVLTGNDVDREYHYVLSMITANFILSGQDSTLTHRPFVAPPPPSVRTYFAGSRRSRIRHVQSRNP